MNCNNRKMRRISAAKYYDERERQREEEKRKEAEYLATLTPENRAKYIEAKERKLKMAAQLLGTMSVLSAMNPDITHFYS